MADAAKTFNDLKVEIISNGLFSGSRVIVNGEEIHNCMSVTWKIDATGIATAMIEIEGVELHVVPAAL